MYAKEPVNILLIESMNYTGKRSLIDAQAIAMYAGSISPRKILNGLIEDWKRLKKT